MDLAEVERRLELPMAPGVLDELYTFGVSLQKDELDRIKAVEAKATSMAAYGSAIITLLVGSAANWLKVGDGVSIWVAVTAATCALGCAATSIRALSLQLYSAVSESEWLKVECFGDLQYLKRYRVLTAWRVLHSYIVNQAHKSVMVRRAQLW